MGRDQGVSGRRGWVAELPQLSVPVLLQLLLQAARRLLTEHLAAAGGADHEAALLQGDRRGRCGVMRGCVWQGTRLPVLFLGKGRRSTMASEAARYLGVGDWLSLFLLL